MKEPIIGEPMSAKDVVERFSDRTVLEDFAFALRDWTEAAEWLSEHGAPTETPEGNWNPMVERIKWVMAEELNNELRKVKIN